MKTIALRPFGIEIHGIQIGSVDSRLAEELRRTIALWRVAVFRDQNADDCDMVAFLSLLGELMFTDGETPVKGAPDLNVVSNVGRTTPTRSVFHTDTSFVERPPAFTALRALALPEVGGSTLFSDQVQAATDLPAAAVAALRGWTVLHATVGPDGLRQAMRHPLLCRHPLTGETALFLSTPERCTSLSGVDERNGRRIIDILYRRSVRRRNIYAHRWREGDIVIWDDRVTMHRADHCGVVGERVLHRGLVRGEVPVAA